MDVQNMRIKIHYLENGLQKTVIVKTEKEQVEFYQRARAENLDIFKLENVRD